LIIIVLLLWKVKGEWADARGEKFDITGSAVYCISLVALMYGFSVLPEILGFGLIFMGIIGIAIFISWELKMKAPVLDMNLFRGNTVFTFSALAALINYSATFAVSFFLSLYLQYIKGITPEDAGLILVAQPIVMVVFSPFAGKLSDRIEPGIIASVGMAITALGLFLFTFLNEKTTIEFIILGLILVGFGFALFSSPNTNAVMSSVEKKFYGIASATLGTMRLVGQMLSMGIAMIIFAVLIGKVEITPEYYVPFLKSVNIAFIVFGVLCLVGVFASLARGKVIRNN
jgi:MFS family permease